MSTLRTNPVLTRSTNTFPQDSKVENRQKRSVRPDMLTESTLSFLHGPSSASVCPQDLGGPFLPVSRSCVASPASGRRTSCLLLVYGGAAAEPDKQMHAVSCVAACIWMCRFNHLTRGLRPARREALPGDRGKGHLRAATSSLSSVTFIAVPFISACHRGAPLFKKACRWRGVTASGCTAKRCKDVRLLLRIHRGR